MKSIGSIVAVLLVCVGVSAASAAEIAQNKKIEGDPARGKALSEACVGCHSEAGIIDNPKTPNLARQHAPYMRKQLKLMRNAARDRAGLGDKADRRRRAQSKTYRAYLRSSRSNNLMDHGVVNLSDQILEDIAVYFESLKCAGSPRGLPLKTPPLTRRCAVCHGEKGISKNQMIPKLAGQKEQYLLYRLIQFKQAGQAETTVAGVRKRRARNSILEAQAVKLSDSDIAVLSSYYARLSCR